MLSIENFRFKSSPIVHNGGRLFLGYANVTLVAEKALPDGSDFLLTIPDIAVSLTNDGSTVIDFKGRSVDVGGKKRHFDYVFTATAASRAWLTQEIHARPEVQRATIAACELENEQRQKKQA